MTAAILSSLSLAAMVILDKLLIKDCYEGDVRQAWFVSTFAGALFGLAATFAFWSAGAHGIKELSDIAVAHAFPYGLVSLIAGALSAQVLYHYFSCFSVDADSTIIASWLAAAPIFVFISTWLLAVAGIGYLDVPFSLTLFVGVLIASGGLALLERYSYVTNSAHAPYRIHLILMLIFNTLYIVIVDLTLSTGSAANEMQSGAFTLAILPYYWIGFLAGGRVMLTGDDRSQFKRTIGRMRHFILPILVVEILGMFVFFFEFLGLSALDPTLVALIVSGHVLIVWIAAKLILLYGQRLRDSNRATASIFGITITTSTLSEFQTLSGTAAFQFMSIAAVIVGISLFLTAL